MWLSCFGFVGWLWLFVLLRDWVCYGLGWVLFAGVVGGRVGGFGGLLLFDFVIISWLLVCLFICLFIGFGDYYFELWLM